eukprot:CAMPEP_0184697946 /NCGR_PEP_ID=MMETSP0313-20130426/4726_1 /TAXON_ID=2792 /ORGANISM="Porphyridium aerugineum, Strain SAG 1380-2" /LENGTH=1479 /DNA_ID=CAMNT_0027156807 /DNA_START=438 /DNA_END=4877 /DNA_ORIENTATION=+
MDKSDQEYRDEDVEVQGENKRRRNCFEFWRKQEDEKASKYDVEEEPLKKPAKKGFGSWFSWLSSPQRRQKSDARKAARREAASYWSSLHLAVKYISSDTTMRAMDAFVNIIIVLLVVTFVCVIDLVIYQIPAIYVRYAEKEVGESDIVLTINSDRYDALNAWYDNSTNVSYSTKTQTADVTSAWPPFTARYESSNMSMQTCHPADFLYSGASFSSMADIRLPRAYVSQVQLLNYSTLEKVMALTTQCDNSDTRRASTLLGLSNKLANHNIISKLKSVPRWVSPAVVRFSDTVRESFFSFGPTEASKNASVMIVLYNNFREETARLGRDWHHRELGELEAHVSQSVLSTLNIKPNAGKKVFLELELFSLLSSLGVMNEQNFVDMVFQFLNLGNDSIVISLSPGMNSSIADLIGPGAPVVTLEEFLANVQAQNQTSTNTKDLLLDQDQTVSFNLGSATLRLGSLPRDLWSYHRTKLLSRRSSQEFAAMSNPLRQFEEPWTDAVNTTLPDQSSSVNNTELPIETQDAIQQLLNTTLIDIQLGQIRVDPEAIKDLIRAYYSEFNIVFRGRLSIVDAIDQPEGKWPSRIGNVFAMEADQAKAFLFEMVQALVNNLFQPVQSRSADENPNSLNYWTADFAKLLFVQALGRFTDYISSELNMYDYVPITGLVYEDRLDAYFSSSERSSRTFSEVSDSLALIYGIDFPLDMILPIKALLDVGAILLDYLDALFWIIVILIVLLGGVLIFSMALSEMQEKTYEFGMLRAMGLRLHDLLHVMVLRGLRSAVPGFILGLGLAALSLLIINAVYSDIANMDLKYQMPTSTIILSILVGFLVPFIANIFPARKALTKSLKDSLDVSKNTKGGDVLVKFERLERIGINWWVFSTGAFLLTFGIVFYYVLPAAFLESDYEAFFLVLNLALTLMLLGLGCLFQMVEHVLEKAIVWILIPPSTRWFVIPDSKIRMLVRRQLYAHRIRNKNAAIMVTMSIAFILFTGALVKQQIEGVQVEVYTEYGSDIRVDIYNNATVASIDALREYLDGAKAAGLVNEYSFVTKPIVGVSVRGISLFPSSDGASVYGIDDSFFDTVYMGITKVDENAPFNTSMYGDAKKLDDLPWAAWNDFLDRDSALVDSSYKHIAPYSKFKDPIEAVTQVPRYMTSVTNQTYEPTSSTSDQRPVSKYYPSYCILSTAGIAANSLNTEMPLVLTVMKASVVFRSTIFVSKLPGFRFSSYPASYDGSSVVVPLSAYETLLAKTSSKSTTYGSDMVNVNFNPSNRDAVQLQGLNTTNNGTNSDSSAIEYSAVFISIRDNPTGESSKRAGARKIADAIRSLIPEGTDVSDSFESLESSESIAYGLNIMMIVVSVMADVLCFIMLWFTFRSSVKENSIQYAVLRSLGVTSAQVSRMYIYESICVLVSSLSLGTVAGLLICVVLGLQDVVVREVKFQLYFPYVLFSIHVGVNLFAGLLSPVIALRDLKNIPVAGILRSV